MVGRIPLPHFHHEKKNLEIRNFKAVNDFLFAGLPSSLSVETFLPWRLRKGPSIILRLLVFGCENYVGVSKLHGASKLHGSL